MAKDKDKTLAGAQKLIQKGQVDKAIKEFEKVLAMDKKDVKVHLKLGDLYSKKKDKEKAIKHYCEAAKYYTKDGFYSKAVAVYKQALQFDESQTDIIFNLADLYHKLGLINDAMAQYQTVATHYERDGMVKEAIETVRRMAELDPKNVMVLTKLAELHYKNGQKEDGYSVFRRALDELKDAGRYEEYSRLLEKLAKADPDNTDNLKELCEIYLKRGVFERAYQVLARIYKNDPDDLESLQSLAQVCVKINRKDEGADFLKALAAKYKGKGLNQKAKDALRKVLQIKPDDPDARRILGAKAAPGPPPAEEEEPAELLEEVVEAEEAEGPIEALEELPEDEVTIEETETQEEPSRLSEEQITEHITEAEVYLKYGLKDKAMHHVQVVLKSHPENIRAYQRLKDIHLDSGDTKKAVSTLYKVSEFAKKQNDRASLRQALQEILEIDPGQSKAQQMLDSLTEPAAERMPAAPEAASGPEVVEEVEEEPAVVSEEPEEEVAEEEEEQIPEVAKEVAVKQARAAVSAEEEARDFNEELEEAEFYIQQGLEDEAVKIYLEILKHDPTHEESLRKLQELGALEEEEEKREEIVAEAGGFELAPEEEEEVVEEEVAQEAVEGAPVEAAEKEARIEFKPEQEEEEEIEEEEEVVVEEEEAPVSFEPEEPSVETAAAPAVPSEEIPPEPEAPPQAEAAPEAEGVHATLTIETPAQEAPAEPTPPPTVEAEVPAPPAPEQGQFIPPEIGEDESMFGIEETSEDLFDLAAELEREDFEPAPEVGGKFSTAEKFSFEDTLSAFKKGVAETVSAEDSSTHYDLGIAYKEMGLLDDAISEFQVALSGSGNPADCLLMIGLCYQEKGQQEQAIETYQKGLQVKGVTNKEAVVFYYELGSSNLSMGDRDQAKAMFEKAQSMDPGFRDVNEKLEELKKAAPPPEAPPAEAPAPAASREQVSWESAALNNMDQEAKEGKAPEEKEEKKPGKKKKISYV